MRRLLSVLVPTVLVLGAAACGDDDAGDEGGQPLVAVSTTVLGDVVEQLVGDQAEVVTIMPRGASPHDFQASARQAADLARADAIVVNGGGLEEGLLSVVEGAERDGVPVLEALDGVAAGDEPADEGVEGDDHGHGEDAHFFTDPLLMADAVDHLADGLATEIPALDADGLAARAADVRSSLEALHDEMGGILDVVPAGRRILVTDHDVFGAFAERFGFEVLATVIPAGSSAEGVSGGQLAALARAMDEAGVQVVFTEATASAQLAETLAAEVGADVEVVALHAETLGPSDAAAGTYAGMLRENAERIAAALGR